MKCIAGLQNASRLMVGIQGMPGTKNATFIIPCSLFVIQWCKNNPPSFNGKGDLWKLF